MKEKIRVRGVVTVRVLDKDGNVKRKTPNWFCRVFRFQGKQMIYKHHNIVTRQGDALIADALLLNQNKTKVTSASGYIQVGTGWTGNSAKNNLNCNTPCGTAEELDANYPALKAAWGNLGDTTVLYRATFEAGDLDENGINEAALLNGYTEDAVCLAYAQVVPSVNVTAADTLQIVWELTILGQ
jgi:hypothetical protein